MIFVKYLGNVRNVICQKIFLTYIDDYNIQDIYV